MTDKEIYPDVNIDTRMITNSHRFNGVEIQIRLMSMLRIFHKGNWYQTLFMNTFYLDDVIKIPDVISVFYREIYMFMHLGVVNEDAVDVDGNKMFVLCEDQTDESERLKTFNKIYTKKD